MKWTEEDIEILTENYLEYGPQWCADVLDRTYGSVRHKASKLGLSRKGWTEEEISFLYENYPEQGPQWCSDALGRTYTSVNRKTDKLGIVVTNWTEEEIYFLQDNYQKNGASFCAKALDRTFNSVARKAERLRLFSSAKGVGNPDAPTFFYIIDILCEPDLYKVGITDNINRRMTELGVEIEILKTIEYPNRKEAFEKEQEMLKKLNKYLENTGVLSNGNTETFRMPPQELDILW
tara:strand:+ start:67 stop:771 length:705 start_codon:yes stop_codon:yes gene_type:complete